MFVSYLRSLNIRVLNHICNDLGRLHSGFFLAFPKVTSKVLPGEQLFMLLEIIRINIAFGPIHKLHLLPDRININHLLPQALGVLHNHAPINKPKLLLRRLILRLRIIGLGLDFLNFEVYVRVGKFDEVEIELELF